MASDPKISSAEIDRIETLIRNGQIPEARTLLLDITRKYANKLFETEIVRVANQCRRVQLPKLALNLLSPIVRRYRENKYRIPPLRGLAEYAMALHRIGGSTEAKIILNNPIMHPFYLTSFYLGLILLSEWEYESAKHCFTDFLTSAQLDDYEVCLGQLNLLATKIFLQEELHNLDRKIIALITRLEKLGFKLLRNNAKEVLIQFYSSYDEKGESLSSLLPNTNKRLREILMKENKLLNELSSTRYSLYLQKWLCIDQIKTNRKKALVHFKLLQSKARNFASWEIDRDCDFYIAQLEKSQITFNRLYYGTPYPGYRRFLLKRQTLFKPDTIFLWYDENESGSVGRNSRLAKVLDLATLQIKNSNNLLAPQGGSIHRTLLGLVADLYRPLSIGNLFYKIYPGEFYDPASSCLRVRQCVFRLRHLLNDMKITIAIDHRGGYMAHPVRKWALQFSADLSNDAKGPKDKENLILHRILKHFGDQQFTALQLAEFLEKSQSAAVRLLRKLRECDLIGITGAGPHLKYHVAAKG
jgi:hypothetical protein